MTAKPYWRGPYLVVPQQHARTPGTGMQSTRIHIPQKIVDCETFGCEWFLLGHSGEDAGFPFIHPAGARCGDFKACAPCQRPIVQEGRKRLCGACYACKIGTSNCPCAGRLPHRMPAEEYPLRHVLRTREFSRDVSGDEYRHRTAEGLYTANHIATRGL